MLLGLFLALLVGLALGLFGGGGSILAVPILTYVVGVPPKTALAASLLIVGITSAVALATRVKSGLIELRAGLGFSLAAMLGAYAGGHLSRFVPETGLLFGFDVVMSFTALAMLRGRSTSKRSSGLSARGLFKVNIALYGLGVGLVSGMVGAGGGFLIVPALVLIGRMPMQRAVATSLLVITLQSGAGFLGHYADVDVPWAIVLPMALCAALGSVLGSKLLGRVNPQSLQRGFAWFVLATAVVMIVHQAELLLATSAWYDAVFVIRWPWWLGGLAIALVVLGLLFTTNTQLGVSTGYGEVCRLGFDSSARRSWRPRFLLGIALGGLLASIAAGHAPSWAMGSLDTLVSTPASKLSLLFGSGLLMGTGARLAGGCTSGHGIVGMALGSRASILATSLFMLAGLLTTQALLHYGGL
ncbi:MAG TPA: TSUP family transporter [Polyangiaceae bacterium]|nr:TSUP family transporter [Polyangiaceae bacterium]